MTLPVSSQIVRAKFCRKKSELFIVEGGICQRAAPPKWRESICGDFATARKDPSNIERANRQNVKLGIGTNCNLVVASAMPRGDISIAG